MSGTIDPLVLWSTASALRDCVVAELADTPAGAPEWRAVVTGQTIIPEHCHCGQLTIHVPSMYPSDAFPDPQERPRGNCNEAKFTAVEYVITVLRCQPQLDDQGRPPAMAEMEAAAQTDFNDRYAMRKAATCCFSNRIWYMGQHLAVGEEGTCAGSELHLLVAALNCEGC
jgi:hypothetical protein